MQSSTSFIQSIKELGDQGTTISDEEDSWFEEALEAQIKASRDQETNTIESHKTATHEVPNFASSKDIPASNSLSLLQCYSSDTGDENENEKEISNSKRVGWDCTQFFATNKVFNSREELTS